MRPMLLSIILVGCSSAPAPTVSAPGAVPAMPAGLALEVTPGALGARTPGDVPALTVAIVNRSPRRTYTVPRPGANAWLGIAAPLKFTYEQARGDGTWESMSGQFFAGHPLMGEAPGELLVLPPGARVVLSDGIPPLSFPEDVIGRMRARLVYDVDAELARLRRDDRITGAGVLTSNSIEIDQIAGPLELRLEVLAPVVAGEALDPSRLFRVMLRNRSSSDLTIFGPGGITAGVGFELDTPNGGVWPKGDRPVMGLAPEPAKTAVLRPGEAIEVYGPKPALGATPGTWTYPVAETFRMRAMYSQPGAQHIHYSNWVTIESVSQ